MTTSQNKENYKECYDPKERLDAYLQYCMDEYWDMVEHGQTPLPFKWHEETTLEDDIEF